MRGEKPIVANNVPVFGWAFMSIWMATLCAMSWLALRDGVPGHSPAFGALVFGVFWLFGVAGCIYFLSAPWVRVVETAQGLGVEERWLFKRRFTLLTAAHARRLRIVDEKDSDGDPYFRCEITLADNRRVALKERHNRAIVEAAQRRLVDALQRRA